MANSAYVFSVQPFSITIPTSATTATATLSTAVGSLAFLQYGGYLATDTTGNEKINETALTLTNSTTVTATRNSGGASNTTTVNGVVIDATPGLVTSVQYGTVTIAAAAATATATISSVTTANSAVFFLGQNTSGGAVLTVPMIRANLTFTNSTTVTATVNTANTSGMTVNFCVVQFNSAALNSLQQFTLTSAATGNDTQTITSVNTANTMIAYGGSSTLDTTAAKGFFYANLASSTSVVLTRSASSTASRTHSFTVIEFKPGVIKAQRGTVALSTVQTTNTATITSVDTSVSYANFTGTNSSHAGYQPATDLCDVTLTNATTVTGNVTTAGNTLAVGYEVISFQGGLVGETGTGTDSASATYATTAASTEAATSADSVTGSWSTTGAISEAGTATDTVSGTRGTTAAITEAGTATDSTNGIKQAGGAVAEAGSALDTVSASLFARAVISEASTATDTTTFQGNSYTVGITEGAGTADASGVGISSWLAGILETLNAVETTDSILIKPYNTVGVNFSALIKQIRANTTLFSTIGFIANRNDVYTKQLMSGKLPAVYAFPISKSIQPNQNLTGYYAKGTQEFGLMVVLDNEIAPNAGQQPFMTIQEIAEIQLTKAVAGFIFDRDHQSRGCFYEGYAEPYNDGKNLYVALEFSLDFYMSEADVYQYQAAALQQINIDFGNGTQADIPVSQS